MPRKLALTAQSGLVRVLGIPSTLPHVDPQPRADGGGDGPRGVHVRLAPVDNGVPSRLDGARQFVQRQRRSAQAVSVQRTPQRISASSQLLTLHLERSLVRLVSAAEQGVSLSRPTSGHTPQIRQPRVVGGGGPRLVSHAENLIFDWVELALDTPNDPVARLSGVVSLHREG